jgi:ABC-type multidrug transport system fused ATPase/permease subunit
MSDFFLYIRMMFQAVFTNLGAFFKKAIIDPWGDVPTQFVYYKNYFEEYSPGFGFWGWVLYIFFLLIVLAFLAAIVYLFVRLIRNYVANYGSKVEKAKLIDQIQKLNYELFMAVSEKNRLLNLKMGGIPMPKTEEETDQSEDIRFPKLIAVDRKYENYNFNIEIPPSDMIPLDELAARFRAFAASQLGLYYDIDLVRLMFAGMGTTKVIILEGISGTGKTSFPYALGKFFQNDAQICSVQPSWRDRSELLGYFNEFTKKFNETDFLKALYESSWRKDNNIIVLDEMNLARIEYYFAEFLSMMEMPDFSEWKIELINNPDPDDPKNFHDGKLLIPQNVWFFGTANNDDSTFSITDKVYDRAVSITFEHMGEAFDVEFKEPVLITYDYLNDLFAKARTNYPISAKSLEKFDKLDDLVLTKFKVAFGNRTIKQLKSFTPIYVAAGGTEVDAIDFIFMTKVLKKFETLNVAFLRNELKELLTEIDKLFGKASFQKSKAFINNLIKMG